MVLRAGLMCIALAALVACGGDDGAAGSAGGAGNGGSGGSGGGSGSGGSAGAAPTMKMLVSADWTLAAGSETYQCTRVTITEDLYVTEFHPVIPVGTHHTVVTLQAPGTPDGTAECSDPFEGGPQQIYGTGVGSKPMILPPGVAVKIAKGQQLHLNLHLFNVGTAELSGTSAIDVVTASPDEIQHVAELHIWGKISGLTVAPSTTSTQSETCVVPGASTVFFMQPHMHQLGKHLKLTHTPAGQAANVLFDGDYSFEKQEHVSFEPAVELAQGDELRVDCTYDNPTATPVGFGESSNDEMCFASMWAYPAGAPFCKN